jgi:hypothetical protein
MKADNGGPKPTAANFAFSALLFSVFAWALIETKLFNVAAGFRGHLLNTAFGLGVSAVALRRCRLWSSFFAGMGASTNRPAPNSHGISDLTSCVALVAAGCVLGLSASTGSITLFGICAGGFNLAPWSRFAFCRRHFITSCSMLGAGAVSVLIVTRATVDPFSYVLWAWILWTYALVALLTTCESDRPAISRRGPVLGAEPQNPLGSVRPAISLPESPAKIRRLDCSVRLRMADPR